jgi:hypothetical protein
MKLYNIIKAYLFESLVLGGALALGTWLMFVG